MNFTLTDGAVARIGSRVRVREDGDGEDEFVLVGPEDADATADRVSVDSPLGHAVLGRRPGEQISFCAPGGLMKVTLVSIR